MCVYLEYISGPGVLPGEGSIYIVWQTGPVSRDPLGVAIRYVVRGQPVVLGGRAHCIAHWVLKCKGLTLKLCPYPSLHKA